MATVHSTVTMTAGELKAWPTLGSLPTMADEELADRQLSVDSLSSCPSDSDSDAEMTKVNSRNSMKLSPEWRRRTALHPPRGSARSSSSSPSSPSAPPAIRAAPGLEDLVPLKVDSVPQYDRCLLLQVRLQLLSLEEGRQEPLSISCQNRQKLRQQPEAKAEPKAEAEAAAAPAQEVNENAGKTTVMLRNLPNQCTRAMLAKFLSTTDFAGQFDLVYVPMDKTSGNNLGYSFINFVEASSCERFIKAMNGTKASKCFPGSRSGKVMQCNYAKVQGAEPYCAGLANAASKLCAMGDELGALETLTPVPITKEPSAKQPAQFQGLRSEAPEFVPGKINADALMETFSAYVQAKSHHQEAFARARAYSSKLFVPGQSAIYVAPKADKENVPAETK